MIAKSTAIVIALLWPGWASAQAPSDDPAISQARALIDQGKPALAIQKLRAISETEDLRVRHLLGVAYYQVNEYARAVEQLEPTVNRFPAASLERREATQILGLSQYLTGHIAESIPFLEQSSAWAPENGEYAFLLGKAYLQTRQFDKSRQSFARMFRVPPDSAAAHLLTAQMMIPVGFEEHAETELKQALQKDSRLPQANFFLGQIALFYARVDEAIVYLKREIEINPGYAMAFYRLGDAFTRLQKWDEAIELLQKSIRLHHLYSGPYVLLGKTYLNKNQLGAAEGMLRQAIQLDPNNKSAHYLLGQVLQRLNRHAEARAELATAERLQGDAEKR
jgi:tetratricopeptide (TPR) repeat protein